MSTPAPENGSSDGTAKPSSGGKLAHWKVLLFGQGISIVLAVTLGTQSKMYLDCDWSAPAFSCGIAFLLLSFHMVPLFLRGQAIRKGETTTFAPSHWFLGVIPLHGSPLIYAAMSILCFYGNYCSLLALSYTTITSTSLFDAMSIPSAMILSSLVLGRKYKYMHVLGATVCLFGIVLNVLVDVRSNEEGIPVDDDRDDGSNEYPHKIVGDIMACIGGIFFGANDMLAEMMVRRNGGSTEYLGMIGFFCMIIASIQASITERESIAIMFRGETGCAGNKSILLLVAYILAFFGKKAGLAKFLTLSEAALLQLSLLTSDIFTAVISVVFEQIFPRNLFWLAMAMVLVGIALYESAPSPIVEDGETIEPDGVMKEDDDAATTSGSLA